MLTEFRAEKFRGFDHVVVRPLNQVNLIAGMNSVGKTSLLEALFLHLGANNPNLAITINALRGITIQRADPEHIWGPLFQDWDGTPEALLESVDDAVGRRTVLLQVVEGESREVPLGEEVSSSEGVTTSSGLSKALVFKYEDESGRRASSRTNLGESGMQMVSAQGLEMPPAIMVSTRSRGTSDDVERFSELERRGRSGEVLRALQILEPRLKKIRVLLVGGEGMIYGDVGIPRLLPLQMLGEGLSRLVSIVTAIASTPDGVVLIDEIENGLHYSVMEEVWTAVAGAARKARAQVFATTHSWECISAAHRAFLSVPKYPFRLHRLERVDRSIRAMTFDKETLGEAIEAELEVR